MFRCRFCGAFTVHGACASCRRWYRLESSNLLWWLVVAVALLLSYVLVRWLVPYVIACVLVVGIAGDW